jgi:hypothetical protein
MKKLIPMFVFLILAPIHKMEAQAEDLKTFYDREAISFFGDARFLKNRQELSRKQVRPFLLKYEESARAYKLFSKNKKIGNAIVVPAAGLYFGSIFFALPKSQKLAFWGLIGSAAIVCISIPFHNDAKKHLQRSVHLYNREILTGK